MAKFELTKKAVEDLADIWNYTYENWSERQADKYYQLIIESFQEIAGNPTIGKNYSGIAERLRGFKVGRHIVFFRELEGHKAEIIRILHEQMDLKNKIIEK
jgi:toxin ParE1/3/4